MTLSEAVIQHDTLLAVSAIPGVVVWRANSGKAWVKLSEHRYRPIQVNIPGCPDIIGWLPDGRFLGIEAKSATGRIRVEQRVFWANLVGAGGVYLVARSADEAVDAVHKAIECG